MSDIPVEPRAGSLGRKIGMLVLAAVILGITVIVVLSNVGAPRVPRTNHQHMLDLLSEEGQPPGRGGAEEFGELARACVLAWEVRHLGAMDRAALARDSSTPDRFDFRDAWTGRGAPESKRNAALGALLVLYGNGFGEAMSRVAAAERIVRDSLREYFLAQGMDEDREAVMIAAEALVARGLVASDQGRHDEAAASFDQCLALARGCAVQARTSNWLVGATVANYALSHARLLVTHHGADDRFSRRLLDSMERRLPLPPVSVPIKWRKFSSLRSLDQTFRTKSVAPASMLDHLRLRAVGADYSSMGSAIEGHFDRLIAATSDPCWMIRSNGVSLDSLDVPSGVVWRNFAEPRGLPNLALVRDRLHVAVEGTRVVLALERFRAKNGMFPDTLSALVPDYLDSVPADPFDPSRPMTYLLTLATSASSSGDYILYSVGADGIDNRGEGVVLTRLNQPASDESGLDLTLSGGR